MQPPGRPNTTSVRSISRLLMRAWAPVSFMVLQAGGGRDSGKEKTSPCGEAVDARLDRRARQVMSTTTGRGPVTATNLPRLGHRPPVGAGGQAGVLGQDPGAVAGLGGLPLGPAAAQLG